jgi:hypothetical protein
MLQLERDPNFQYIKDDPVRPQLTMEFRIRDGREVYSLTEHGKVAAVICVAYTTRVAITVDELERHSVSHDHASIAMFYTIWSYKSGAGRKMIFAIREHIQTHRPTITRFITLSPKTEMAYRFHTGNGAIQIAQNKESDNYEYF